MWETTPTPKFHRHVPTSSVVASELSTLLDAWCFCSQHLLAHVSRTISRYCAALHSNQCRTRRGPNPANDADPKPCSASCPIPSSIEPQQLTTSISDRSGVYTYTGIIADTTSKVHPSTWALDIKVAIRSECAFSGSCWASNSSNNAHGSSNVQRRLGILTPPRLGIPARSITSL